MSNKQRNSVLKADINSLSLMYTLHAISRMSKDEFELLKKLRKNDKKESLNESEIQIIPRILEGFSLKSIQDVIDIVENFKLFELYDL